MLAPGEDCDCAHWFLAQASFNRRQRVISLANPAGRLALVEQVWGLPGVRRSRFRIQWPARPRRLGRIPRWIGRIARALGRFGRAPEPRGTSTWVPSPRTKVRGAVLDREQSGALVAPASGAECLAFGLELHARSANRPVVLRDALTSGFDVELVDGRRVRVLPGRVRIDGDARTYRPAEAPALDAFLDALDPGRTPDEPLDPIPFDLAIERVVRAGAVIELASDFELAGDGVYRDAAETLWVVRGLPWIGIVRA